MIADLHSHTTASDGEHSPAELVKLARAAGVVTLAVTDHDTVAGLAEAEAAAKVEGISFVPGIELAAFLESREVHVLGHFIDREHAELRELAAHLEAERTKRMRAMVERLREHAMPLSFSEVMSLAGGKNVGRPHLARVMLAHNFVRSLPEAFDCWIGEGRPGFVQRFQLKAADAIAMIGRAGGAATVAHPFASKLNKKGIAALKSMGLAGIEVLHPDQPEEARRQLREIARDLDLVPTAGSDFHGASTHAIRRLGATQMDEADLARLAARRGTGEARP